MEKQSTETQVCIIGAGVMGASAAFHLAERGQDVLMVEKSAPGLQASGANAGTLAVQNKKLDAIPLVLRSLDLWETLSERLGMDVEYEKRGGFRVAHSEEDLEKLEQQVSDQRAKGVTTEMVYQPRLASEAPYLSREIKGASYCPRDSMANPLTTTRAFLKAARRLGARLWRDCEVTGIQVLGDQDFNVATTRGTVRCSTVIAAAGAWSLEVARMAGITLPLSTKIMQVLITTAGSPLFPHIVTHVRGNLTLKQQRESGKIILGGGWRGDGDRQTGTKLLVRESVLGSLEWAAQAVPGIAQRTLLRGWVGFEGRTPDKLLISGPLGPRGLFVLGCSGGGFTLSPIAGQLAAEYVVLGEPTVDCERFNVQRFLTSR